MRAVGGAGVEQSVRGEADGGGGEQQLAVGPLLAESQPGQGGDEATGGNEGE
jgi:hypothetical protein